MIPKFILKLGLVFFCSVLAFPSFVSYERFLSILAKIVGEARTTRVPLLTYDRFHFYGLKIALLLLVIGNLAMANRKWIRKWIQDFFKDSRTLYSDFRK